MKKKKRRKLEKQRSAPKKVSWSQSGLPVLVLGAIVVLALAIRVDPVVRSPETLRDGLGPFGDSYLYHVIAYNLYKGNGFSGTDYGGASGRGDNKPDLPYEPAAVRAPMYPAFVALVYRVFGSRQDMLAQSTWHRNFDKVRLAQCVLDALVCVLVFLMVRFVYPVSVGARLVAATLYAFSVYTIFYTRALLTESLATFLVATATLFSILALARAQVAWWFAAGAGWGLTALCRPEYVPFSLAIMALACLASWRRWRVACVSLIAVLLGVLLTLAPWVMRNYVLFQKPVVAVGGLGYSLFVGTFERNTNWTGWDPFPDEIFADANEKEAVQSLYGKYSQLLKRGSIRIKEVDDAFLKMALDRIRREPLTTLKTWVSRIPRLWYQFYIPMYRDPEPSGGFFIFYFLFAVYAFVSGTRRDRLLMAPIALLFVYLTLLYLPLHVEPRYGVPAMPALISLCGIGLWKLGSLGHSAPGGGPAPARAS